MNAQMTALSDQVSQLHQAQRGASAQQLNPTSVWSTAMARFIRLVGWPSDAEPDLPADRLGALRSIFRYQTLQLQGSAKPTPCLILAYSAVPLFRKLLKIVSPNSVDITKLTQGTGVDSSIREESKLLGLHCYHNNINPFPFVNEKALLDGQPREKPRECYFNVIVFPLDDEVWRALRNTQHDPSVMQRSVSIFRHWLLTSTKFTLAVGAKMQWDGAKSNTPLLHLPPPVYAEDLKEPALRRILYELGLAHGCHYSAGWVPLATPVLPTPAKRRRRQAEHSSDSEAEVEAEAEGDAEDEEAPVAAAAAAAAPRPLYGGKGPHKSPQALAAFAAAAAAAAAASPRKKKRSKKVDQIRSQATKSARQRAEASIPHHRVEEEEEEEGEDDDDDDQPLSVQVRRKRQHSRRQNSSE